MHIAIFVYNRSLLSSSTSAMSFSTDIFGILDSFMHIKVICSAQTSSGCKSFFFQRRCTQTNSEIILIKEIFAHVNVATVLWTLFDALICWHRKWPSPNSSYKDGSVKCMWMYGILSNGPKIQKKIILPFDFARVCLSLFELCH